MNQPDRVRAALAKAPLNRVTFYPRGGSCGVQVTVAPSLLDLDRLCVRIDNGATTTMTVDRFVEWMDADLELYDETQRGKWLDRMQNAAHEAALLGKPTLMVRRSA